ncbi:MAG TPA: hypothetical protein VIW95_17150 [Candidatus Binatus sp.]|uniref:hypothetical protein n=1 Tax=Candidatus Binatus sp. TaxID=2811406 RepID=UPI002F3FD8FE
MLISGIAMVMAGFLVASYLLAFSDRNAASALSLFGLTIIAGVAIPNIPRITHMGAEEGKSSISLDMQQAIAEVKSDAAEVKLDKNEILEIKAQLHEDAEIVKEMNAIRVPLNSIPKNKGQDAKARAVPQNALPPN